MEFKTAGTYRPLGSGDKKATRRERRLGRVAVTPQINFTRDERRARKRAEAEVRLTELDELRQTRAKADVATI